MPWRQHTTHLLAWLYALGLSMVAYGAPLKPLLATMLGLVFIDTVTGCWAALKRKQRITSAGFRRTFSKALVYCLGVVSMFLVGKVAGLGLEKVAAGAICVVEGKSILENLDTVYGGGLFASVIAKLGSANDSNKPKGE